MQAQLNRHLYGHAAWLAAMNVAWDATAQVAANRYTAIAQCGPNFVQPAAIGGSGTLTADGFCATSQGGSGSTNHGECFMLAQGGEARVIARAESQLHNHLFNSAGGLAQGTADFAYPSGDVVFTNTANPGATGPITTSLNFVVQLAASTSGSPDPVLSSPTSSNRFRVNFASSPQVLGNYDIAEGVATITGAFVGYPNDGSPQHVTTAPTTVSLGSPTGVTFTMFCYQTVHYLSQPPSPRNGTAQADFRLSLPCGSPVFNLPPGFTANSASMGIVNNMWQHASCGPSCDSIDFNADGLFPDAADVDDFLSVFSGGPCSNDPACGDVDFNNDGLFPDSTDIDALLSVFSGGPCL
jgi:hypothetical protein